MTLRSVCGEAKLFENLKKSSNILSKAVRFSEKDDKFGYTILTDIKHVFSKIYTFTFIWSFLHEVPTYLRNGSLGE